MTWLTFTLMMLLPLLCGFAIGYYYAIYRIRKKLESIEIEIEYEEDNNDKRDDDWISDPDWWKKR